MIRLTEAAKILGMTKGALSTRIKSLPPGLRPGHLPAKPDAKRYRWVWPDADGVRRWWQTAGPESSTEPAPDLPRGTANRRPGYTVGARSAVAIPLPLTPSAPSLEERSRSWLDKARELRDSFRGSVTEAYCREAIAGFVLSVEGDEREYEPLSAGTWRKIARVFLGSYGTTSQLRAIARSSEAA